MVGMAKAAAKAPVAVDRNAAYPIPSSGHWIKSNIERGQIIVLEDGSMWEVDRRDRTNSMLWLSTESVAVVEGKNGGPGYDYLLVNSDSKDSAHAKYLGNK